MELSLFDLHCDTAYEMYRKKQSFSKNSLAVSLENAEKFKTYIQVMALWTDAKLSDEEGWPAMLDMHQNLLSDPAVQSGKVLLSPSALPQKESGSNVLFLAIEDARILNGRIERVDTLARIGVRIITPLWWGETLMGGSHNTDKGLSPFGKAAMQRAMSLGIIGDISHASKKSSEDIFCIAEDHRMPVIASHSNLYSLCPVSRNLTNDQVKTIVESDGLIGLNLYTHFLKEDGNADIYDILRHIDGFLALGAEDHLALGCDMDGAELPKDIPSLAHLPRLYEAMLSHGYSEILAQKIFFDNAHRFTAKYLFI